MASTTSTPHAQTNNAEDTTTDLVAAQPTLQALNAAQAAACEEFGRPPTTRKSYNGYLARGFKFLQNLVDARREAGNGGIGDDGVDTDLLEKAFGNPPNKYSLMALEAFMMQKCFHEGKGEATANGIQSAFADYWDHMGGRGIYATEYFYNEVDDTFRGSPACAPSIRDMIKAVKARAKVNGGDRVHAEAMCRPELAKAMNCSEDVFPSEAARRRAKDMEELLVALKELEMRAMFTSGFKLWTRNFELNGLRARHITRDCIWPGPHYHPHIKVLVENCKGYQGKTGNDGPLETKQYNIYPDPNAPEMDMYSHLLRWLDYLERHIGRPLKPDEFIFPYISSNGTIELNRAYKHTKIQKLINKFTLRAGLTKYYTTHCFRRGGAQSRFMDAPMEERWSLRAVRWWGAWADNESVETLMKYLFDMLQSWETSYGDQLCPSGPRESFMDNHRHERPATAKEFKDFSSSLLAAVQAAVHPQHDGSAGAPLAIANPSAIRASSVNPAVSPSIENASPPLPSVSHRPSTLSMLGAFPVNMHVTHLPSPPPTTTAGPSISNAGPSTSDTGLSTSNADPSTSSAGWISSDASLFSPIIHNPMADPALINSFISPPVGLPMGYSPYTAVLPHFNHLTTHHPWAFPSASSPVLDPFFDSVSHHGGASSISPLAYNISTYFPQPNLSYFPPPLTSYAPSSGASGPPSPEAIVPASQPNANTGYAPPGPLLTSNALNRRASRSTCPAVLEPPASIASIPDLDRRHGKGGWRQAISQWENVDPQTGFALKDWPRHWYTGESQVKLHVKRGYRKSVALEYKRLGGTERQFLNAHPEADTITFLKLVKKINVQNGSVSRASKNGPPDARLQSS